MIHWWIHLSFSAAMLWLIVIVGIISLTAMLCCIGRQSEVLPPPHWATKRRTAEAPGKVRHPWEQS